MRIGNRKEQVVKRIATQTLQSARNRTAAILALALCAFSALALSPRSFAQEAPDVTIKRAVAEVTSAIDADREIRTGSRHKITLLINAKVLPYLDVQAMTRSALGRHWGRATPEQQQALVREFSRLLVNTYAGAFASYRPETVIDYKPLRMQAGDGEAVVRSMVKAPGGEPIQLDYYLELASGAWKVTDINVLGARLVETYKNQFNGAIAADGIDGLLKTLTARNQAIEARNKS
jgi:phospholipid transport system substrate-binding protein